MPAALSVAFRQPGCAVLSLYDCFPRFQGSKMPPCLIDHNWLSSERDHSHPPPLNMDFSYFNLETHHLPLVSSFV